MLSYSLQLLRVGQRSTQYSYQILRRDSSTTTAKRRSIRITRNVQYSHYEQNVMDVYESISTSPSVQSADKNSSSSSVSSPIFLFVHGGLWMKGSKEESPIKSHWDLASHVLKPSWNPFVENSKASESEDSHATNGMSNVGRTIASKGGRAYVANYRLANHTDPEPAHPNQALDVARFIAHVIQLEIERQKEKECKDNSNSVYPRLFVGGYSAGAHLTALVLSDSRFLKFALLERGLSIQDTTKAIAGYIGISGVYNLNRLSQGYFVDHVLNQVFWGNASGGSHDSHGESDENDHHHHLSNISVPVSEDTKDEVLRKASPVHVLLSSYAKLRKGQTNGTMEGERKPILATIPILLLNAENDLHLSSDAQELLIALDQFSTMDSNERHLNDKRRKRVRVGRSHVIIPGRNHLSIMWEFGNGHHDCAKLIQRSSDSSDTQSTCVKGGTSLWSSSWISSSFLSTSPNLLSYFDGDKEKDEAAQQVLNFILNT